MFELLDRHYKLFITALALLLAAGYVHKQGRTHNEASSFEYGYYAYENWEEGKMRWTWRKAYMRFKAISDLFGITIAAAPYNSTGSEGLTVKIYANDEELDILHFFSGGRRHLYYFIPDIKGKEVEIRTEVDRTFNPLRMGISEDGRELGVAVSPVTFLDVMPKDGVGFYPLEVLDEESVRWMRRELGDGNNGKKTNAGMKDTANASMGEKRFRWTGKRASREITQKGESKKDGWVVFLRCAHPDVAEKAVEVEIWGDAALLQHLEFVNHDWKKVEFSRKELEGKNIITYEVSRTWNPKKMGISEDGRDLGVAVAVR